jgi:hypothetical protein
VLFATAKPVNWDGLADVVLIVQLLDGRIHKLVDLLKLKTHTMKGQLSFCEYLEGNSFLGLATQQLPVHIDDRSLMDVVHREQD